MKHISADIIYVLSSGNRGGAQKIVELLMAHFNDMNIRLHVVCSEEPIFLNKLENINFSITKGIGNNSSFRSFIKSIYDMFLCLFAIQKPCIVHAHNTKAGLAISILSILLCHKKNLKFIRTIHGWGWRGFPFVKSIIIYCCELIASLTAFNVDYIYVSSHTLESSPVGIQRTKNLIYNSTPQLSFDKDKSKEYDVVMVARNDHSKDHLSLIKSCILLRHPVNVVFCGYKTDDLTFKKTISDLIIDSNVTVNFLGQISDVGRILSRSRVFCLISNFEAFPMTILEAIAYGLPVIATDVGGVNEIISNNHTGRLIKPSNNPQSIKLALTDLLLNETYSHSLATNAKCLYDSKFSYSSFIAKHARLYSSHLSLS